MSDLNELERDLETLKRSYEMFFSGTQKHVPYQEHERISQAFKNYPTPQSTVDRFKLQSLRSRFSTYSQLWEKQLQNRESSRSASKHTTTSSSTTPTVHANTINTLYDAYHNAHTQMGSHAPSKEAFAKAIEQQAQTLRSKYPNKKLVFKITEKNGKPVVSISPV